jgi:hypothetical protein
MLPIVLNFSVKYKHNFDASSNLGGIFKCQSILKIPPQYFKAKLRIKRLPSKAAERRSILNF